MLTHPIPVNVVTARLMTARYVKALVSHQERELCLAGLWVITGFEQRPITFRRAAGRLVLHDPRSGCRCSPTPSRRSATVPLIYIFQIGMAVMALSVVAAVVLLYMSLNGRIGVPGWASIMVSIWFLGGLIIFCVGVIGMYLAKIFTEIKQRPYTIVRAEYGSRAGSRRSELATLLRGQARDYYEAKLRAHGRDAGGRGLELAGVAGAALRAARASVARRAGRQHRSTTAAATARWPTTCARAATAAPYVGFDVSEAMAEAAHARVASLPACRVTARRRGSGSRPTTRSPAACSTSSRTPPTTRGARTSGKPSPTSPRSAHAGSPSTR